MSRRSDQRRAAAFALYQHDVTPDRTIDELLGQDASRFTRALVHAADDYAEEVDPLIARHARGWALERIAPLERAIMRVALTEMLHPDVVPGERPIPPEGAIDEAVETAKRFCGAEAPGFVNGILNAVLQDMRHTA